MRASRRLVRSLSAAAQSTPPARPEVTFSMEGRAVDVMGTCPVLKVETTTSCLDVAATLTKQKRHAAVVVDEQGELAGLLSERDFLTKLSLDKGAASSTAAAQIMTPKDELVLGSGACSVDRVVRRMRKERISSFPLLDDDTGDVLAVIHKGHIARQIFDALNQENEGPNVGDMLDWHAEKAREGDVRGCATSLPPYASLAEAVDLMRDAGSGSLSIFAPPLATHSHFVMTTSFGLFTEREYVASLPLLESRYADDVELFEVARFSRGKSKSTMRTIHDAEDVVRVRPESITAVERATPVRDCLSLMIGNDLLYAPVTEHKKPIDVVSLRDINLYLAPTDGRT